MQVSLSTVRLSRSQYFWTFIATWDLVLMLN